MQKTCQLQKSGLFGRSPYLKVWQYRRFRLYKLRTRRNLISTPQDPLQELFLGDSNLGDSIETVQMVASVMTSINHAITILGTLKDLDNKEASLELRTSLLEAKEAVLKVKEELLSKDAKILELMQKLNKKENLVFEAPAYYMLKEDGKKDGPFCQVCHDKNGQLVRIAKNTRDSEYSCKGCNNWYPVNGQAQPRQLVRQL